MTIKKRSALGLLACLGIAISFAGSTALAEEPAGCKCRAPDKSYAMGSCTCLERPGSGKEIACCEIVLNNTSWRFTGKSCPTASAGPNATAWIDTLLRGGLGVAPMTRITQRGASEPY